MNFEITDKIESKDRYAVHEGLHDYNISKKDWDSKSANIEKSTKYKGTLIVVKDCKRSLKFYQDLFGLELVKDNDGNMELTERIYLQESCYWEDFILKQITAKSNQSELYFEEPEIEKFAERLESLYPETEYVNHLTNYSWGQKAIRFYDPDGNLIEVGTPV